MSKKKGNNFNLKSKTNVTNKKQIFSKDDKTQKVLATLSKEVVAGIMTFLNPAGNKIGGPFSPVFMTISDKYGPSRLLTITTQHDIDTSTLPKGMAKLLYPSGDAIMLSIGQSATGATTPTANATPEATEDASFQLNAACGKIKLHGGYIKIGSANDNGTAWLEGGYGKKCPYNGSGYNSYANCVTSKATVAKDGKYGISMRMLMRAENDIPQSLISSTIDLTTVMTPHVTWDHATATDALRIEAGIHVALYEKDADSCLPSPISRPPEIDIEMIRWLINTEVVEKFCTGYNSFWGWVTKATKKVAGTIRVAIQGGFLILEALAVFGI
jgi:hypothetical protein